MKKKKAQQKDLEFALKAGRLISKLLEQRERAFQSEIELRIIRGR